MRRPFREVDVFCSEPFTGNPVAVVLDAAGLTTEQMRRVALWANLSETTFVLPASRPGADYRVRIFTPAGELPFAGHPTLGTCHAWLEAGNSPAAGDGAVVQECAAGLVPVRRTEAGLAFAAPPLVRSGPVDEPLAEQVAAELGVSRAGIAGIQWADNGPGWIAVLLPDAGAVLALRPGRISHDIGVAGLYPPGSECAAEVRCFFPVNGMAVEDPVTGSFNASLAQWLCGAGLLAAPYVASQGTAIGRRGRVHVSRGQDGAFWIGGAAVTRVSGEIDA